MHRSCSIVNKVDLSDLFYLTKSDKRCDYEIAGWKDQDGNEYAADGKLKLSPDTENTSFEVFAVFTKKTTDSDI